MQVDMNIFLLEARQLEHRRDRVILGVFMDIHPERKHVSIQVAALTTFSEIVPWSQERCAISLALDLASGVITMKGFIKETVKVRSRIERLVEEASKRHALNEKIEYRECFRRLLGMFEC